MKQYIFGGEKYARAEHTFFYLDILILLFTHAVLLSALIFHKHGF